MIENLYKSISEAVIWIAYKEWLSFEQLLERYRQQDVFWGRSFYPPHAQRPLIDWEINQQIYPHDTPAKAMTAGLLHEITKNQMLVYVERIANKKSWTDEEWGEHWSGQPGRDVAVMRDVLQSVCVSCSPSSRPRTEVN